MNTYNLKVRMCGKATVDSSWSGEVILPTESRLYYILGGAFTIVSVLGETTVLEAGKCYLLPAGFSFTYGCEEEMTHIYFHVRLSGIDGMDMLQSVKKPICLPFSDVPRDVYLYDSILAMLKTESFLTGELYRLLSGNGIVLTRTHYSENVKNVIEYVKNNLSMQMTVREICAQTCIARSTITRDFKKETGMTIGEYIDFLVFREAENLLCDTDIPMSKISEVLGFSDQFYFARKFFQRYGISPTKYRQIRINEHATAFIIH